MVSTGLRDRGIDNGKSRLTWRIDFGNWGDGAATQQTDKDGEGSDTCEEMHAKTHIFLDLGET